MKWSEWKSECAGMVSRVQAIDLFRFFVLFFMIQGHLFRSYLLPALRQQEWYNIHEIFHGFVAPGFLFTAGFAAFLSFHNKRQNYISLGRAFFKRLRRILFVIAIGYWIHLPFLSLRKTLQTVRLGQAPEFLKVDILQCIGAGLLLFTLLAVVLKNEKIVVLCSGLAGALFFLLPEAVKGIRIHPALDPYFNYDVSIFPVFPWVGFLCLGIVAAFLYSQLKKEVFFKLLLLLGILFF
ncbi:MAG TPA: heparan-alpha-glucosaminide N-acetyltransferase domain-containing protein, partial [Acidobacteriota bacterium]